MSPWQQRMWGLIHDMVRGGASLASTIDLIMCRTDVLYPDGDVPDDHLQQDARGSTNSTARERIGLRYDQ